jgi:hypothetical protein
MRYLAILALSLLSGCMGANISANLRQLPPPEGNLQTRCERVDMRDNAEMEKVFKKYDGWRVLYVSEYTTSHRFGTIGAVCFERGVKG